MGEYYAGKSYQKHIHFPKTGILCKKDSLARLIKKNRVSPDSNSNPFRL